MRLKIFIYHNPVTEEPIVVYEYPWFLTQGETFYAQRKDMYTFFPGIKPILFIEDNLVTEIRNQRVNLDDRLI